MTAPTMILAWMLSLSTPGQSPYSAVTELDGVVCDTEWTEGCRRESWEEGLERWWGIAQAIAMEADQDRWLAKAILVVTYHESGAWRRDVHSGVGKFARGDKGWSWGLGQKNVGPASPKGPPLVGLDEDSTRRSIAQTAADLRRARNLCRRGWLGHNPGPECVFAAYGGVWGRGNRLVLLRVGTWGRMAGLPSRLKADVREALGLDLDG